MRDELRLAIRVMFVKKVSPKLKGKFYRVTIRPMLYEMKCYTSQELSHPKDVGCENKDIVIDV